MGGHEQKGDFSLYVLLNFQFIYASVLDYKVPQAKYMCFLDTYLNTSPY